MILRADARVRYVCCVCIEHSGLHYMYIRHQSVTFAVIGCISLALTSVGVTGSLGRLTPSPLLYSETAPTPPTPPDDETPEGTSGGGSRAVLGVGATDVYLDSVPAAWRDLCFLIPLGEDFGRRLSLR